MDRTDPKLLHAIVSGLGLKARRKAEIYKLVLYEEGASLPHQDSDEIWKGLCVYMITAPKIYYGYYLSIVNLCV